MSFQCSVVTPEAQVLSESAKQVILPAHDGLIGILTDRSPLLVKLGIGELRVDLDNGTTQNYVIDGGIAQMKDNKLTILTDDATPAAQIDAASARAAYAEAEARVPTDQKTADKRNHDLQRARVLQRVAGK